MPVETIQVPMFQASDGAVFDNKADADAHEALTEEQEGMDKFIDSLAFGDRTKVTIKGALVDYVRYRATGQLKTVAPA
ncbi:MAG: hypothetical protein RPU34_05235 [Candidatus Sedimenticola sp. (ex Thyasira tokunagai)]